jgi:hypothetical protein
MPKHQVPDGHRAPTQNSRGFNPRNQAEADFAPLIISSGGSAGDAGDAGDGGTGGGDPDPGPDPRCASASANQMAGTGTTSDPYLICLP